MWLACDPPPGKRLSGCPGKVAWRQRSVRTLCAAPPHGTRTCPSLSGTSGRQQAGDPPTLARCATGPRRARRAARRAPRAGG
eukprot:355077-Chlamydomonas_euryale.AAC.9